MGSWILMLLSSLIIPFVMIVFGGYLSKKAPNDINYKYGYRTIRSMKNKDTWEFAHKYCGKLWVCYGIALAVIVVIVTLIFIGKSKDEIGDIVTFICLFQLIPLIATVIRTEIALKKNFDENGNKK